MSPRFPFHDRWLGPAALVALGAAGLCSPGAQAAPPPMPNSGNHAQIPLHAPVTKLFPGGEKPPSQVANAKKYQGSPVYIAAGKAMYNHYNCSGCHFHGAGGMGPPFMNGGHFIYGGKIDQIFASIYQGRPNGMPSWGRKIPAQQIWEIAAYVKALSMPEQELTRPPLPRPKNMVPNGDPKKGAALIKNFECGACHQIPGIEGANGLAGPPLTNIADRTVIAGVMPNTPGNLMAWIEQPQSIVHGNAMPNLGLNDNETRDIAAYLYTLH